MQHNIARSSSGADGRVVSCQLGIGLLGEHGPDLSIDARMSEDREPVRGHHTVHVLDLHSHGDIVVDQDNLGYSLKEELDSVDSLVVNLLCYKKILERAFPVIKGREGSNEEAVTKLTLFDGAECFFVGEHCTLSWPIHITESLPFDIRRLDSHLCAGRIAFHRTKARIVGRENWISPFSRAGKNLFELGVVVEPAAVVVDASHLFDLELDS